MRSLVILFVGCLPLAVLTVESFVELAAIDDRFGGVNPVLNPGVNTNSDDDLAAQRKQERPLVGGLAEVDLLFGESLAGIERVPETSSLRPVRDSWPQWVAARDMVADFLQIERLAEAADRQRIAGAPLDDLNTARHVLGEEQQKCEDLKRRYETLRQKHQDPSVRGAMQFLALLDSRLRDLDRQIEDCRRRIEAADLLSSARSAFAPHQYGECVALCDKLLGQYSSVLDASVAAKVQILRQRAQFRDETERLFSQLDDAPPAERQALLETFLATHDDRASRTESEQQILDECAQRLREVKAQLEAEAANRAADELMRDLEQNPPETLDDRLRSAVQILDRYPTDSVKVALRANAKQWIGQFLPEKQIREPPELHEAETTRHEIIRGFFADVVAPDGTLLGYKRYPTLQARSDPRFDVGTYYKEEFLAPPGESVPRRCVGQYGQARDRLLEAPGRRAHWEELADLCESLEADLREYRRKQGASTEDPELSFEQQARFVRELLAGSGWAHVETLFGG
jgi:hypothetical protein